MHDLHKPLHALGGRLRIAANAGLEIVRAQHEDDQIQWLMGGKDYGQCPLSIFVHCRTGVIENRRAAAQPLLDRPKAGAKRLLHHARPAHVFAMAKPGLGIKAPGQAVPVAQYAARFRAHRN